MVFDLPAVGSIGLDHVKSLGNTEEKIAKEKSGVFKVRQSNDLASH